MITLKTLIYYDVIIKGYEDEEDVSCKLWVESISTPITTIIKQGIPLEDTDS